MTTTGNDFDAAKAVTDQLKGMDKERQQRVLRWVAESLGLDVQPPISAHTSKDAQHPPHTSHVSDAMPGRGKPSDIKSFVEAKKPKSDVQFAAVVAYYYSFEVSAESRKQTIDAQTLQEAARLAGRRRPPKPLATLNNAKTLGYLDAPQRGLFSINSVGENLVAMTLPGDESGQKQKTAKQKKSRKAK